MNERSILITGCSSGIGLDAARTLHARGWRVFAACRQAADVNARRAEGLESVLIDHEDAPGVARGVATVLDATDGALEALFNNGAYAIPGRVEDLPREALAATALLMALAFALVLMTNRLTILLSMVALALALVYPFTKRVTHFPQLVLGAAFGFAIPMAFAAETNSVPPLAWALYLATLLWAVAYDTLYAMADREDDLRIGVKSTAVLFGRADLAVVGALQGTVLALLALIGWHEGRGALYAAGLLVALVLVVRQLRLARDRDPAHCIAAFLDNNRFGLAVFVGLAADFAVFG